MPDTELIEIPIDDEITLGFDHDGLPRTEPVVKPTQAKAPEAAPKKSAEDKPEAPAIDPSEFAAVKRRADESAAQYEAIQKELEAERDARVKAEKAHGKVAEDANRVYWEGVKANWDKINTDRDLISNSKSFLETQLDIIKDRHRAAAEAADSNAQTEAAAKMAEIQAQLRDISRGLDSADEHIAREKRRIENEWAEYQAQMKRAKEKPEPEERKEPEKKDPPKQKTPEEWIAQFPRKLAGWLTDHKDYVTDPSKHKEFLDFANEWAADYGQNSIQTPQFVQALQDKFTPKPKQEMTREEEMADEEEVETEEAAPPPKKSAPAAPVSRSSPGRPGSGNTIKLTTEQHAVAPELYPNYNDLSPETQKKFPAWSPTAARFQYHQDLRRAESEGRFK